TDSTGLRSDVIPLYNGSEYWLYRYKKYTDVRLVFAPEQQTAFYGGDPDNFTYPRYDLDIALFRVYENDAPVHSAQYFKWNSRGASDGDLVFVSGNPGSTDRQDTMAEIKMLRDYAYPLTIQTLNRRMKVLRDYGALGTEQAREASNLIFGLSNSLKALGGEYQGLKDKDLIAKKQSEEDSFRAMVDKDPRLKESYGAAWDEIAQAEARQVGTIKQLRYRSTGRSFSRLAGVALTIVQYVAEVQKPDSKRLDGFHDSQLDSLKFGLFSPAPVYPDLERRLLADSLQESVEQLGKDDPFVKAVLGERKPEEVANDAIAGTKLADPDFRKKLVEGGEKAVQDSDDPLIALARKIDPFVRQTRKWTEDNVEGVVTAAGEKIGKARFAVYGKSAYPDATFTLRLSYGTVKGYPMNGTEAPSKTTFYGLYDRAYSFDLKPPFDLPERYRNGRQNLDLSTPLDFVSTCDIIGGNSGSPVIDRQGEIVGVIFDGNIESLVGRFIYDEKANRAVSVATPGITEALLKLYGAQSLVDELEGRGPTASGSR
ncbi:MAG TPA: S46 family peptidase, partial [Blastocatellia bacterium]|nr:S46 family peptidase [Blastocatellia bacterium]